MELPSVWQLPFLPFWSCGESVPSFGLCEASWAAAEGQSLPLFFLTASLRHHAKTTCQPVCWQTSMSGGKPPPEWHRRSVFRIYSPVLCTQRARRVQACQGMWTWLGSACVFLASPLGSVINRDPASCCVVGLSLEWAESLGKYGTWSSLAPRFPWQPPEQVQYHQNYSVAFFF